MIEFLTNLVSDAGALIVLYAPVILTYVTQIIDWIVTYKKIASVNVKSQVAPILKEVKDLKNEVKDLVEDNKALKEQNAQLIEVLKGQQELIASKMNEQEEELKHIVQDNISLRADLRRKTDGSKNNEKI